MQGLADRGGTGLRHTDVGAHKVVRRATNSDKRALVTQELHDVAAVDERNTVRRAILNAVRGKGHDGRSEAALLVRDHARQGRRVVEPAGAAVIEHQRPAGEVRARRACDLDRFADIGAAVVVMDFVDENLGHCRWREQDSQ